MVSNNKAKIKNLGLKNRLINNRTCQNCDNKVRSFHIFKGKFLCYKCYRKQVHIIPNPSPHRKTMEEVLNKVYEIKGYINKNGSIKNQLNLPQVLIGHKIKISLAD